MATIVNTPGSGDQGGAVAGWVIAIIVIIALVLGGFYLLPRLQSNTANQAANPASGGTGTTDTGPTTNNVYNTTITASSTINTGTTTVPL